MSNNFFYLKIASKPENVPLARILVSTFASQLPFTLSEIEEIRVATSEAVSNAVIHGYEYKEGIIEIEANLNEGKLNLTIQDFGKGIPDIELARQATYSTDPERMGLGLTFMESFMDELVIKSEVGKGTLVLMSKRPEEKEVDKE